MFEVFSMIQLIFPGTRCLFVPLLHVLCADTLDAAGTAGTGESCCCGGVGKHLVSHLSHWRNPDF